MVSMLSEGARPLGPAEAVARNAPCGCGSGAKWKHCCGRERFRWREARDRRATLRALGTWR